MRHPRWARLAVVALASLVGATGFGITAEVLAGQAPDSTLRLKTVSTTQLDQLGIKLVATRPPPYCTLSDAVNDRGWARGGLGGCPISRRVAEKDSMTGGNLTVVESTLARATMPRDDNVGQNHLVWVVVVQSVGPRILPAIACPVPVAGGATACVGRGLGGPRLLLLDGQTGATLYGSWAGGLRVGTMVPRLPPIASPPKLPAKVGQTAAS
jgi:hypothetical protein